MAATPLEAAVAELLRQWEINGGSLRPSLHACPWLYDAIEALRAAHAIEEMRPMTGAEFLAQVSAIVQPLGEDDFRDLIDDVRGDDPADEYQRGRREGAAEERAAMMAELHRQLRVIDAEREHGVAYLPNYLSASSDAIQRVRAWLAARAAPAPSREETR